MEWNTGNSILGMVFIVAVVAITTVTTVYAMLLTKRSCPHCRTMMPKKAAMCPHCQKVIVLSP